MRCNSQLTKTAMRRDRRQTWPLSREIDPLDRWKADSAKNLEGLFIAASFDPES
jgi:hypothetical protein